MSTSREIAVEMRRADYQVAPRAKQWARRLALLALLALLAACSRGAAPAAGDELIGLSSRVMSFSLVDSVSGQPFAAYDPLPDGAVLDPATLPTGALAIRANTDPHKVGSVRFSMGGREATVDEAPYLLNPDDLWPAGAYRLTAVPYTHAGAAGMAGAAGSVRFTVTGAAEEGLSLASDDPAIFYSPLNWRGGEGFMASSTPGAYLKLRFSGSSLALELAASAPWNLRAVIDGVAVEHRLSAGASRLVLAEGLEPGEHLLELYLVSVFEGAPGAPGPEDALRIRGFVLDAGARLSPAALRPKRLVVLGDTVAEGRAMGRDDHHDAALAYTQELAEAMDAEMGVLVALSDRTEQAGAAALAAAYGDVLAELAVAAVTPDYIVLAPGPEQLRRSQAQRELSAGLMRLRDLAPTAAMFVAVPFSGAGREVVAEGFRSYQNQPDRRAYLIDLGAEGEAILASHSHDGHHPDEAGHRLLARALSAALRASLAAPAPRPPLGELAWRQGRAAPQGVTEAQGTAAAGKLYVFGGYTAWEPRHCMTLEASAYDPARDSWTKLSPMPEYWTHAGAVVDGRNIYLAGGYAMTARCSSDELASPTVYRYDIDSDSWHRDLPPLPKPRGSGGFVLVGRNLHFFGGTDSARVDKGDHWVLSLDDPSEWKAAAPLPNPRSHVGAASLGGKIYVIGGQHGYVEDARMQRSMHVYDPASDRWSELAPLPAPLSHTTAATFVLDGRIITVAGERKHDMPVADVLAFDPGSNSWSELAPLPAPRRAGVAGVIDGRVVYSGGHNFAVQTYLGTVGR